MEENMVENMVENMEENMEKNMEENMVEGGGEVLMEVNTARWIGGGGACGW